MKIYEKEARLKITEKQNIQSSNLTGHWGSKKKV
jgi:hypothetical protein